MRINKEFRPYSILIENDEDHAFLTKIINIALKTESGSCFGYYSRNTEFSEKLEKFLGVLK